MRTWHRVILAGGLLAIGLAVASSIRPPNSAQDGSEAQAPVLALRRPVNGERPDDVAEPPVPPSEEGVVAVSGERPTGLGVPAEVSGPLRTASVEFSRRPVMASSFSAAVGRPAHRSTGRRGSEFVRVERQHAIRDGDTLESISRRYYGDARYARFLFDRNRDLLRRPDLLPLGAELRIPPRPPSPAASQQASRLELISLE